MVLKFGSEDKKEARKGGPGREKKKERITLVEKRGLR
jgi:hypothetical protein